MALLEAKERVEQLEIAIQRLASVKDHLNTNAGDVKTEIHNYINRSIECLHSRESCLTQQASFVVKAKEDRLQRQQIRLKQALSLLRTGVALVQDDAAPESQLAETLQRLKQVELSPEETPYISFRADHVALRDSIQNYGRVDGSGLPLLAAFEKPGNTSCSLPGQLEDYGDADHHLFHKTVPGSAKLGPNINVTIPKLSTRAEDWLLKKTEGTPVRPTRLSMDISRGKGADSTPGSAGSINNWLATLKRHTDLEEEHDFEIVDNSFNRVPTTAKAIIPQVTRDFFQHVSKDPAQWLLEGHGSAQQADTSTDFFAHIATDPKLWLAYQQLTALEEQPYTDVFAHIPKDSATWLRSRFAHNRQAEEPMDQSANVSVSNRERSRSTQALASSTVTNNDKWLLKKNGQTNQPQTKQTMLSVDRTGPWLQKTVRSASDPWLQRHTQKERNFFCHMKPASDNCWLAKTGLPCPSGLDDRMCQLAVTGASGNISDSSAVLSSAADQASSCSNLSKLRGDINCWLANTEGSPCESNGDSCWLAKSGGFSCDSAGDVSNWLAKTDRLGNDKKGDDICCWLAKGDNASTVCGIENKDLSCWLAKGKGASPNAQEDKSQWLAKCDPAQCDKGSKDGGLCWLAKGSSPAPCLEDLVSWPVAKPAPEEVISITDTDQSDSWSVCSSTMSRTTDLQAQDVAAASQFYNKWLM